MRKLVPLVAVSAVALTGCGVIGGRPQAPDEFQVARNAPLVIPPDYSLTPPVAGTAALTPQDAQQQAIDALFGGPAPRSQSESHLLDRAGRDRTAIGARSTRRRSRHARGGQRACDDRDPERAGGRRADRIRAGPAIIRTRGDEAGHG